MPNEAHKIPNFTFSGVEFGPKESPWDLNVLMYKGGAAANAASVQKMILEGKLGAPLIQRLDLVSRLHSEINQAAIAGSARTSLYQSVRMLRVFFSFVDARNISVEGTHVVSGFCAWADELYIRTTPLRANLQSRSNDGPISNRVAWLYAAQLGTLLDRVLDRPNRLIQLTRLYWRPSRKSASGVQTEKQSLSQTLKFGETLQDLCDGITLAQIKHSNPSISVGLRSGKTASWDALRFTPLFEQFSWPHRINVVNLRIEAELMMFLAQTGMNQAQAQNLEVRHFSYASYSNGYRVTDYKKRRGGQVLFEIFKEYRPHFERFLAWRRDLFKNAKLLFPFIGKPGSRHSSRFTGERLRKFCKKFDVPYVGPRKLRNTRVNWLLQASSDPSITSDLSQHAEKTLLRDYYLPSYQRTIVETIRFWERTDPHHPLSQAVAPGACVGPATKLPALAQAPTPDCLKPSGCLWCESHRDVDSFDHVWALHSFMQLKVVELSLARTPRLSGEVNYALKVVDRIRAKIAWFMSSTLQRQTWVQEAQSRMDAGDYHPDFRCYIEEMEGVHD